MIELTASRQRHRGFNPRPAGHTVITGPRPVRCGCIWPLGMVAVTGLPRGGWS